MTSPKSGYFTVIQNASKRFRNYDEMHIAIPPGYVTIVSFKRLNMDSLYVIVQNKYQKLVPYRGRMMIFDQLLWVSFDLKSNFGHMFNISRLDVSFRPRDCIHGKCFQLFFSVFRENIPTVLSTGVWDVWNCSVGYYASFHHHLACNMKTECEDGRDETEHCPFSSPDCQGLVDLCDRCYSIDQPVYRDHRRVTSQMASDYCISLGGTLGLPKCVLNWIDELRRIPIIHKKRWEHIWVGLSINEISLPALYRYVIIEDTAAHFHSVRFSSSVPESEKKCLANLNVNSELKPYVCDSNVFMFGAVCEFKKNTTKNAALSKPISLTHTESALSMEEASVTLCSDGQATHAFLLCGSNQYEVCGQEQPSDTFSDQSSCMFTSRENHTVPVPLFACSDETSTLSYTLVCDFVNDCQDKSDESFCKHPHCDNKFACTSGHYLAYDKICDQMPHCRDESDNQNCNGIRMVSIKASYFPSPVLIKFDGIKHFVFIPMKSNDSCPDTHYRCPGVFNDCLPVYTRCNAVYDCLDHKDEEGCEEMACPGFFRCRVSTVCVHRDHLCDGWPHCPMHDDELSCHGTCPMGCQCQGHAFLCRQPFPAALFFQLRWLDAAGTGMTLSDVGNNTYLLHLVLARCLLTFLPDIPLLNLKFLDLGGNRLEQVNMTSFAALDNLQVLSLSSNPITSMYSSVLQQSKLTEVDLSLTTLTLFDAEALSSFPRIQKLNLTFTSIHTIGADGFWSTPQVTELRMAGSPVKTFPPDMLKGLSRLRIISAENYKICCSAILFPEFDSNFCYAPKDEISSCEDLLQSWTYRAFLWLTTSLSLAGNVFCFCTRLFATKRSSLGAFSVFVTNLTMADFLMGVYSAIIGGADERFRGRYLHYDDIWKSSVACKVAGFLSLVSSEVSALIILLITLDRFVVLRFPFSSFRFDRTSASVACLLSWLVGWFLALLPLLPPTLHWEFYSQTSICIPLPITRQQFKGKLYSFSLMIVLNFVLFILISAGQGFIYWSVQSNSLKTSSTKMSRDMTVARRLITVAVTDFLCWFPIGLCGMLAAAGLPIPGEVNVALAVFVLPLNSAVNPFLYTFNTLAEKRRKSSEARFLKWLESHADLVASY